MIKRLKKIYHFITALASLAYYRFPAKKMIVIGITGTDGKTTTVHLISHILKTAKLPVSFVSSVEASIMGNSIDTGFHVTTPSAFQLQKLIRLALNAGTRYLVLEVTSHALDQFRNLGSSIDIALINNISHEHLDYHETLEKYRQAKAKILKGAEFAVLNRDDINFSYLKKKVEHKLITFSLKSKAKVNKIKYNKNPHLLGKYNKYNILATETIATILKISPNIIKKAIETFPGVIGRLEQVKNKKNLKIYIDFAHKINALDNVLSTVKKITPKKLIAVFGSAGLRDRTKRPFMGEVAAKSADYIVLTAEDPRTEDVRDIIDELAEGCLKRNVKQMEKSVSVNKLVNGQKVR